MRVPPVNSAKAVAFPPVIMEDSLLHAAMIPLPAGSFRMGGRSTDKFSSSVEFPLHEVTLNDPPAIGRTPVRLGEWRCFDPDYQAGKPDDWPVTGISFPQISAYLHWLEEETGLAFRLPSEAEWEYACRGGSEEIFPGGNQISPAEANYAYDEQGEWVDRSGMRPVASYPPNRWGLHDIVGTVSEWTSDLWHNHYRKAPEDGSSWIQGGIPGRRVIRGGAWDQLPRVLRCSWRDWAPEEARWDNLGFRLALDLSPSA